MGCGGSVYMEDGSIAPGKGETKMELNPESKLRMMFYWSGEGKDKAVEIKPGSGKEMLTGNWDRLAEGQSKAMWIDLNPGSWQQRYVIDHERIQYPGAMTLGLCEKIFAQHNVDPTKFGGLCVTAAKQSKEEHPYKGADGNEVAKRDLDDLATFVSAHQMSENLQPLKKALVLIEDTIPGNMFNATANFTFDVGYWEAEGRVLSGSESLRLVAEAKLANPAVVKQVTLKTAEVARKLIIQSMDTACAMIKMKRAELLPTLEAQLDILEGRKPGSKAKPQDAGEKPADVTPEEVEKEKVRIYEKLWEMDKPNMARLHNEDREDKSGVMRNEENVCDELYQRLDAHYKKSFDPKSIPAGGVMVMARWNNTDLYEALATELNGGTVRCEFPENKLEETEFEWVAPVEKIKKKVFFPLPPKEVEVDRVNISPMPPQAQYNDLCVGLKVRVLHATKKYYYDANVIELHDNEKQADVRDAFLEVEKNVQLSNIWLKTKLSDMASKPRPIRQHFYSVLFTFVGAQDANNSTTVTLNLWRTGARAETLQSVKMTPMTMRAKPTKKNPEPNYDVHTGWQCLAEVMIDRAFSVNYVMKVGDGPEQTFVDFGKPAKSQEAYRRFYMKLNI